MAPLTATDVAVPLPGERRRRVRIGVVASGCILIAGLVLLVGLGRNGTDDLAAPQDGQAGATTAAPSTVPSSPSPADAAPVSAPHAEPELPTDYDLITWGAQGIQLGDNAGEFVQVFDQPVAQAVLFDAGLVAYQADMNGPVAFLSTTAVPDISFDAGITVQLLDGTIHDGRPFLLIATSMAQPTSPEAAEDQLITIDITTGAQTVVETQPGLEHGIASARFAGSHIALLRSAGVQNMLDIINQDGTKISTTELTPDANWTLTTDQNDDIVLLQPAFTAGAFTPQLTGFIIDPEAGSMVQEIDRQIVQPSYQIEAGFCAHAAITPAGSLICSQSSAPLIRIDAETNAVELMDGTFPSAAVASSAG